MCSAIVLSTDKYNYRKVAQQHYKLTDEQMKDIDIHHNPPRCEGGRNIPEHLYVYHPATHKLIHDKQAINWAKKSKGNSTEKRGKPPKKTEPTQQELSILKYRQSGLSRKEVADLLGLKEHQVKRAIRECSKFGYELHLKSGPKKGCEGKSHTEEAKQKIKEKRAQQVFSQESLDKRSESMKKHCQSHTWSRKK
jgi:DNA-binding CsgD family transcriptional regulator